ncbi:MAG TPA: cation:proton antiporter [Actinomycetota bacterium]
MEGHGTDLIATIAIGLGAAFIGGFLARLVKLPAIVGYLLAGVAIGPFTPGLVADQAVALELAEIGVALLMFGVGLHFSVRDLMKVRTVAVPGALGQIAISTLLGVGAGFAFGWDLVSGLVLGLAVSVASTVVLLRALRQRDELDTDAGRVATGWLIVEDLFTVIALVLLPILAVAAGTVEGAEPLTAGGVMLEIGAALGKAAILTLLMLVVGARLLPWLLNHVQGQGSRELFTLAVVAIALGVAYLAAQVFDVSLALGAFLAGAVLSESRVSERAAHDVLPLTDVFSVLFFVSVGMLLDPAILRDEPLAIVAVVGVVIVGKAVAALLLVAALKRPLATGLLVAAGLAQIGEFSFIVATTSLGLDLLPEKGFQLIVAASLISITLNPALFALIGPVESWATRRTSERTA